MFDFENGDGVFKGWDHDRKSELRNKLFSLIPKYAERGMSCAILDPDVLRQAEELGSIRREFHRDEIPYLWCMTRLVKTLGSGLTGKWADERVTFVFAKNQYSDIARHCYDWIKETAPYGHRLAGTITFAPIEEHPGLEAADILRLRPIKVWMIGGINGTPRSVPQWRFSTKRKRSWCCRIRQSEVFVWRCGCSQIKCESLGEDKEPVNLLHRKINSARRSGRYRALTL